MVFDPESFKEYKEQKRAAMQAKQPMRQPHKIHPSEDPDGKSGGTASPSDGKSGGTASPSDGKPGFDKCHGTGRPLDDKPGDDKCPSTRGQCCHGLSTSSVTMRGVGSGEAHRITKDATSEGAGGCNSPSHGEERWRGRSHG